MVYDPHAANRRAGFGRRLALYLLGVGIGLVILGYFNAKRTQSLGQQQRGSPPAAQPGESPPTGSANAPASESP